MTNGSFQVSGSGRFNQYAIAKINDCFNQIQKLIDGYKYKTQEQDYAYLSLSDFTIEDGTETFFIDPPVAEFNVYGFYGTTFIKIGVVHMNGQFESNGTAGTFNVHQIYRKSMK